MADANAPFRAVELKDVGQKTFATPQEVVDWLAAEIEFWSWAARNNPTDLGLSDDRRNHLISWVRRARDSFANYISNNQDSNALQTADQNLQTYVGSGLASNTARARFINGLRSNEDGEIIGQAALAEYMGSARDPEPARQNQKYRYPSSRGRVAMAIFDAGIGSDAVAAISASMHRMSDEFNTKLGEQVTTYKGLLGELTEKVSQTVGYGEEAERERSAKLSSDLVTMNEEKTAAIKEIHDTRKTYMEFMRIKAAVDYWRVKGDEHQKNAKWWLRALTFYSGVGYWS